MTMIPTPVEFDHKTGKLPLGEYPPEIHSVNLGSREREAHRGYKIAVNGTNRCFLVYATTEKGAKCIVATLLALEALVVEGRRTSQCIENGYSHEWGD